MPSVEAQQASGGDGDERGLGVREAEHETAREEHHQQHGPVGDTLAEHLAGQQSHQPDGHCAEQRVQHQSGEHVATWQYCVDDAYQHRVHREERRSRLGHLVGDVGRDAGGVPITDDAVVPGAVPRGEHLGDEADGVLRAGQFQPVGFGHLLRGDDGGAGQDAQTRQHEGEAGAAQHRGPLGLVGVGRSGRERGHRRSDANTAARLS